MRNKTVSILIVDDDEIDIRLVRRGLQKYKIGNPVYEANDGVEALEMLRGENGHAPIPSPCLILLDLNMPRMTGHEFLEVIRNDDQLGGSVVFVLTTSNDDRDVKKAYDQHVAGYLLKSDAGRDFVNHLPLLDEFLTTVQFPVESTLKQPQFAR